MARGAEEDFLDKQEVEAAALCESTPCLSGIQKTSDVSGPPPRSPLKGVVFASVLAACLLVTSGFARYLGYRVHSADPAGHIDLLSDPRHIDKNGLVSTSIRWLAHPEKCLDVAGKTPGAALQIWDCDPNYPFQQRFFVPKDGDTGHIKWAQDPTLCLDSPGGHAVQFWACDNAPAENLMWTVSADGKGFIHWAAHPTQCLDVPDEKNENGWKLQVWYCSDASRHGKDSNLRFVTHAVDCQWGDWGEWGVCSRTCGGGQRLRTRYVAIPALNGGHDCGGIDSGQAERCQEDPCGEAAVEPFKVHSTTTPGIAELLPEKDVRPLRNSAWHYAPLAWTWLLGLAIH